MFNEITSSAKKIVPSKKTLLKAVIVSTAAVGVYAAGSKFGFDFLAKSVEAAPKPF